MKRSIELADRTDRCLAFVRTILGLLGLWAALVSSNALAAALVEEPKVELSAGTNAVVRWSTDVPTGGHLRYGPTLSSLTQSAEDEVRVRHAVTLKNLQLGTKYYFSVGTAHLVLATNSFTTPVRATSAGLTPRIDPVPPARTSPVTAGHAPAAKDTWANPGTLRDHFERHGADFKAKDPDDYARQAWELRQRARAESLPAKMDEQGVLRVFDPKTGAFAAYNRDGKTKTFFKPQSRDYFDRQPGRKIDAKTLQF